MITDIPSYIPYGSFLIIEVHKEQGEVFYRFFYNNNTQLQIVNCELDCPHSKLQKHLNFLVFDRVGDFLDFCYYVDDEKP